LIFRFAPWPPQIRLGGKIGSQFPSISYFGLRTYGFPATLQIWWDYAIPISTITMLQPSIMKKKHHFRIPTILMEKTCHFWWTWNHHWSMAKSMAKSIDFRGWTPKSSPGAVSSISSAVGCSGCSWSVAFWKALGLWVVDGFTRAEMT
jgi:hypothetical protein